MSPVAKALNIMQAQANVHMGWLVPTITLLTVKLDDLRLSNKFGQPLIDALRGGIKQRFGPMLDDPELIAAAILLPKFRTSWTSNEDMLKLGLNYIKTRLEQESVQLPGNNSSSSEEEDYFSVMKGNVPESARQLDGYLASTATTMDVLNRNHLHLQEAQLQQALLDVRGGVEFAERLLSCGSDTEILNTKGVTLRRLTSLAESSYKPHLAALAPDDSSSICFLPIEPAGEIEGYPLVGVINSRTLDVSRCTTEGEDLRWGSAGQKGHFTLTCRDSAGEQMARGGEHVLVNIVHKDKKNCTVQTTVVDNTDGTYSVSYKPEEPGLYSVWICVKAQHIKGSPFNLDVKRRFRHHAGTFHCCSFCSSGGAKEACCGCPGTMPGGFKGCGHGHQGHPGKPHWSCCGSTVEKSECLPQSVLAAVSPRSHLRTVEL
ncbi:tripartite motif-containing protein 45 [Nematolebias whitei]|uniref:tripartite motif-containing protein 45 n=1 Tax=Nematolebias whitei TaxID=451745 RepID=UPI001897F8ED|nr:tripartite motif-containing protein 45 [Nematolebias whitei]